MTVSSPLPVTQPVVLCPRYWVPLGVAIAALPFFLIQIWLGWIVLLFASFLAVQAATLRMHFTPTALELYRGQTQIRRFPYTDWSHWEIFWPSVPILFYFREVNSIHFTPMLFEANLLKTSLEQYCPRQRGE
jgi:hypothetical protein